MKDEILSGALRIRAEELEKQLLSPYATLSVNTRGRQYPMEKCHIRTEFVRDRDRIIHCKSFRRLKHKTQVFLSPVGDHYRTRLTHTLEVSQIARTIARGLRLNEDLTEAIAMGHDLGHTPFGHAWEKVLNSLVTGGFRHNEQSLRVVEKLENGKGLNLTFEVRDGILNHPSDCRAATPEGRIVSLSDRIAYINHDIDDAVRAGILNESDLPKSCVELLGASHGERINTLILDTIANSFDSAEIRMSSEVWDEFKRLRDFMFERVYLNKNAKHEETKGMHVIAELFKYYKEHIDELPEDFKKNVEEDGKERVAADWIACMSDRYAISDYEKKFVPKEWM